MKGGVLSASAAALDPPRAHGEPPAAAQLRAAPEDFVVEEDLGFEPAGSGAHLLLRVRKRDANTRWVARTLARIAGCRTSDVGYAGLKDRHALATQWFSVPRPREAVGWARLGEPDFEVLEAHGHTRKLPRGALAGNRFAVRLRAPDGDAARLAARLAPRLEEIARRGVPNYFGPQRFGREGANLAHAGEELRSLARERRGFVLSAARSALFNAVLAERVQEGSWEHLEAGDLAVLDGRGSYFCIEAPDESLSARARALAVHPSGPMWGRGVPPTRARVLELELRVAAGLAVQSGLCASAGMVQERRSLRLAVGGLGCAVEEGAVVLRFRLARAGFATAVLRELIGAQGDPEPG